MRQIPDLTLRALRPSITWNLIFVVGIAAVTAWGWTINATAVKRDALRTAAVQRCAEQIPTLQNLSKHLGGVGGIGQDVAGLANTRATDARQALALTPKADPFRQLREDALARIKARQASIADHRAEIAALPSIHVPTIAECEARAKQDFDR